MSGGCRTSALILLWPRRPCSKASGAGLDLDRAVRIGGPFRHRTIIHAGVLVAENLVQPEPDDRGPVAGVAEGDVLLVGAEVGGFRQGLYRLGLREEGMVLGVEIAVRDVDGIGQRAEARHDRALRLALILLGRTTVYQLDAGLQCSLHLLGGHAQLLADLGGKGRWLRLGRLGRARPAGGVVLAPAAIEDGDGIVAEILE